MSRTRIAVAGVVGLVAVVAGFAWWLGFFSDTPDEVSIDAAVESVVGGDADATATTAVAAADVGGGIDGTWSVSADPDVTFVGYRINEVLTTIGDFEVVGRTSEVTGTLTAEDTSITSVSLVAQMTGLTTDSRARDQAMRSQALETARFPEATFVLASPIDLDGIPAAGETIDATANGDLTIHGVTQRVDFPLQAQLAGGSIVVVGQLPILLADYDIDAPSAPIVASVEDNALLELSLAFERS